MARNEIEDEYEELDEEIVEPAVDARRPKRQRIEVLHQDDDIVVLSKPPGLWMDVSPGEDTSVAEQLIQAGLLEDGPDPVYAYSLDPPVSGIAILSRSESAASALASQVTDGSLKQMIRTIVRGPVMKDSGTINFKLSGIVAGMTGRMKVDAIRGSDAATTWTVRDHFVGFAVLECHTKPAVPHQIRVHLEAAGIPLAVDPIYSGSTKLMLSSFKAGYRRSHRRPEKPLIDRVSLHVASVEFRHPRTGEPCRFECAPPKDFRATLHQLERFGRKPR
ncbi:MAG: hypothetical protein HZA51_09190 [Planctomycetes bacterium]|nr:hypothetical protein [Planctomycetota bacterium]